MGWRFDARGGAPTGVAFQSAWHFEERDTVRFGTATARHGSATPVMPIILTTLTKPTASVTLFGTGRSDRRVGRGRHVYRGRRVNCGPPMRAGMCGGAPED